MDVIGIGEIDLSIVPTCSWDSKGMCIGNANDVLYVGRFACGCTMLACQECRDRIDILARSIADEIGRVTCFNCANSPLIRGCDLIRWTSI